jgi:hypothetical protein
MPDWGVFKSHFSAKMVPFVKIISIFQYFNLQPSDFRIANSDMFQAAIQMPLSRE